MTRKTREDWIKEGLLVLSKEGVEAITIGAMCDRMSVTKGSFYHHFTNRDAYLEAILAYWEETYTLRFIERSLEGHTPAEQIDLLQQQVIDQHGTAEVRIRAWAQVDEVARTYQQRVDQRRMDFLRELYMKLTGDEAVATRMAHMIYAILIGSTAIVPPLTAEDLAAMYTLLNTQYIQD